MSVETLLLRNPTGAMLWEIWGKQKWKFARDAVALVVSWMLVHWSGRGIPADFGPPFSFVCFFGAYLDLIVCFGYIEVDARKVKVGFPGHLLLKPVSTTRLVVVPMAVGGAAIFSIFVIWAEVVLRQVSAISFINVMWISTVLLSLFWWMQTLAWSLPLLAGRSLALFFMVVLHLLVGIIPQLPFKISTGWRWGILGILLASSMPVAILGLKWMRRGRWEGPSSFSQLWSQLWLAQASVRRKAFRSAFAAQFWLEWRMQGFTLPVISGAVAMPLFPTLLVSFKLADVPPPPASTIILVLILLPLLLSGAMGGSLARFDPIQATLEVPVYIGVRPMTNGSFVLAKLVMALTTSALACLVSFAAGILCLAIQGQGAVFSRDGLIMPFGTVSYATGCLPFLLLLIILTWKNLLAGIGPGLTGRPWIGVVTIYTRLALLAAISIVVFMAKTDFNLEAKLTRWLPVILAACLSIKVAFSCAAFSVGYRRNAITGRTIAWIVGGWFACALFTAIYACHICHVIGRADLWLSSSLLTFLFLPLADLAIAPLALSWNRHR